MLTSSDCKAASSSYMVRIIPTAQQIHFSGHLVRYHIPGINPKATKSPFLLLELIANHSVTFHDAATVS